LFFISPPIIEIGNANLFLYVLSVCAVQNTSAFASVLFYNNCFMVLG